VLVWNLGDNHYNGMWGQIFRGSALKWLLFPSYARIVPQDFQTVYRLDKILDKILPIITVWGHVGAWLGLHGFLAKFLYLYNGSLGFCLLRYLGA
jgi:hypothetical protein